MNGRLDSLQAAVLLEKLTIFDEELSLRAKISNQYRNTLKNYQYIPNNYTSSHALFSIILESNQERNKTIEIFQQNNIPTMIYYKYPIHLMKAFSFLGYKKGNFLISENLSKRILSLPMHPYLSENDIELIILILEK